MSTSAPTSAEEEAKKKHVMLIDGFCNVPWMEKRFSRAFGNVSVVEEDTKIADYSAVEASFSRWKPTFVSCFTRDEKTYQRQYDKGSVRKIRLGLASGLYHAVIVIDLVRQTDTFTKQIGPLLKAFVQEGGLVAFPTTELGCVTALNQLFESQWEGGSYGTFQWSVCEGNKEFVEKAFGSSSLHPSSATSVSLLKVPPNEQCHCLTREGSPNMLDGTSYGVPVAVHRFGSGGVGFFGDTDCQAETLRMVGEFLTRCSSPTPIGALSRLDEGTFAQALEWKQKGNQLFSQALERNGGRQEYGVAIAAYDKALGLFDGRPGQVGNQRQEHANICSNKAECQLRIQEYSAAERSASDAISLEPNHTKALVRRAKARYGIRTVPKLELALEDVKQVPQAKDLFAKIQHQLKQMKARDKTNFAVGFSSAIGGGT